MIRRRSSSLALALLATLALSACRGGTSLTVPDAYQPVPDGGIDLGEFKKGVRPRLGMLPFTGPFTLFEEARPDALGVHNYSGLAREGVRPEKHRGVLYACRAGFIDVSHLRKSADLCRYAAARVEFALLNDWSAVRMKSLEPSVYTVTFEYPDWWKTLPPEQKRAMAKELSIRIGQHLGHLMINWHEILTFFGYRATVILPEKQSAFTYDDTGSHALGVEVAGRAMRDAERDWDRAMTFHLNAALKEYGVVDTATMYEAIKASDGLWWATGSPLRRHVDISFAPGGVTEAWIVPNFAPCAGATPARFALPTFDDVRGRNCRDLYSVRIDPRVGESAAIRKTLPDEPQLIDPAVHLPILMQHMRDYFIKTDGPQAVVPN